MRALCFIGLSLAVRAIAPALAEEFPLPPAGESVVGRVSVTEVRKGESMLDIARAFDLGHDQILSANPLLNRWVPPVGARVIIPARYILPNVPWSGIVLNRAELRLYYFQPGSGVVLTYPVSIGDIGWETPRGTTRVISKKIDPAWSPPPSIRREHEEEGDELPAVIPGGAEDNPLGHYALELGIPRYLIHGTNPARSYGIGLRVSHGCIRLYPEDIEQLFPLVAPGTMVRIIDVPTKVGWSDDTLYMSVHRPFEGDERLALPEPDFDGMVSLVQMALRPSTVLDERRLLAVFDRGDWVATAIGRGGY